MAQLGVDTAGIASELEGLLGDYGFQSEIVKLSRTIPAALDTAAPAPSLGESRRVEALMDMGNLLCDKAKRADAVLAASITDLIARRQSFSGERRAIIFSSLKRVEELTTLRNVYGRTAVMVGVRANRVVRETNLTARFSREHAGEKAHAEAVRLMRKDELEAASGYLYGQNVLDALPATDLIIDISQPASGQASVHLRRLIRLAFNESADPLGTPYRDEQCMAFAHTAMLRSASLSRRVGAAICDHRGQIVATGVNEVPRPGGGHYWPDDQDDARDVVDRGDWNKSRLREVLIDLLQRLAAPADGNSYLADQFVALLANEDNLAALIAKLMDKETGPLGQSEFRDIIEFHRSEHAEASAIADCARRGIALEGTTLFSTSFPCHLCAKEILAAGIERVIYLDSYAKSLADRMFPTALEIGDYEALRSDPLYGKIAMEPFVGIAPRRFFELFDLPRRYEDGIQRRFRAPIPALREPLDSVLMREQSLVAEFGFPYSS